MQFSNEPKRCYHTEPCDNEGTIFRDRTRGPLYDPRWYCEDHIEEADVAERKRSTEASLRYQRGVITNLEKKLASERIVLENMTKHPL